MGASASRLGLTHKHRKRTGDGILQFVVKSSTLYCFAAISLRFGKKFSVLSFIFLDLSLVEWRCRTLWTGEWAAATVEKYFSNYPGYAFSSLPLRAPSLSSAQGGRGNKLVALLGNFFLSS